MPADLHGRAGIAPLAEHLVEPRGAQAGILRQGVADERQKRVKGARAAHAPAEAARLVLPRGAHRFQLRFAHLPFIHQGLTGPDHRGCAENKERPRQCRYRFWVVLIVLVIFVTFAATTATTASVCA